MIYTPGIEQAILEQIEREPDRPIILPDWAYWEGIDTPWVYIDGMPEPLPRVLYERVVGTLPEEAGLAKLPDIPPRNVNPHLFAVVPARGARAHCVNGHVYRPEDWREDLAQHRCQRCRALRLLGIASPIDINRAKRVCPEGHDLVKRPNGRRRCLECPRETQKRYLERKRNATE